MSGSEASLSTSLTLIRRAQAREPEAWTLMAQLYAPLVYRWVRIAGITPEAAEDLVQEVFVTLLRKITGFSKDRKKSSFRGWLWTVTRNLVHDFRRRQATEVTAIGGEAGIQQLNQIAVKELQENLPEPNELEVSLAHRAAALIRDRVDPSTWEAFWRRTVQGEAAVDIAQDLGMTPRAVRQAKYRILCQLRELLADR